MLNAIKKALSPHARHSRDGQWSPVFELSQSGLFIMSLDLRLVLVNDALADMLGYEPDELVGVCILDLIVPDDMAQLRNGEIAAGDESGEMREVGVRLLMKGGIAVRNVVARFCRTAYGEQEVRVGSVMDVTDLRRGETALRDYARRLQLLSRQVIDLQENERANLARELHDEIGQQLTLVKLSLEALRDEPGQLQVLEDALECVAALTGQVRDMSLDLRPSMLDDLGLVPALRWYAGRAAKLAGVSMQFQVDEDFPRMQASIETLFFRVGQEAITNVLRHSGAETFRIRLGIHDERVVMEIRDDGQGFDASAARSSALTGRSTGLLGMRERAALATADLQIDSTPDRGTRLVLSISRERAGIRRIIG